MSETSTKEIFPKLNRVCVFPPDWPGRELKVQPGDLSKRAPYGNGFYGYQDFGESNPFTSAPPQEACGGVTYFGNDILRADFEALMRIMGVCPKHLKEPWKDFAVFISESTQPGEDGYLVQMRIVSRFGLRHMFNAITDVEYENFPKQEVTMTDALWLFMEQERSRWGTHFWQDRERGLAGLFGGDGDCAREELSFGFMVENDYYNIYRIWSRAWLVTK